MMNTGSVTVSDSGAESFSPNDASNFAMVYYQWLVSQNSTRLTSVKTSGGPATYLPPKPPISNPPTDEERAAYSAWVASKPTLIKPPPATTSQVLQTVPLTPAMKQQFAANANSFSAMLVPYLQANAVAIIPATSAGDGLMLDSASGACKHPATQKTIKIG